MKYSMLQAINSALRHAMNSEPNVILMGQDIAENGGVFRATDGLSQVFGKARVINSPISEVLMSGMATGMAVAGLKPVIEFQFSGFMLSAVEQLMIHAGRMRSRTQGRLNCPLVFRAPYGAGIGAPEHHSESPEALFAHIPGIRVIIPSTPSRAHGLLLAAINDPDPVVFLEPKKLYHTNEMQVTIGHKQNLDQAIIDQEGSDLTIIAWGSMLPVVHSASENCSDISCEIIDLCSVYPLDQETLISSVKKTGRVLVVHEACRTLGLGAEILAIIAEHCTPYLLSPPQRITGYDMPTPYFKKEHNFLPKVSQISKAICQLMEYQHD